MLSLALAVHVTDVLLTLDACMHAGMVANRSVCVPPAKVLLGFLWHFPDMNYVDFVENTLFKSSGDIADLSSRLMKEITIASF